MQRTGEMMGIRFDTIVRCSVTPAARRLLLAALLACLCDSGIAQTDVPHPITDDQVRYMHPPGTQGVEVAWIVGAESQTGPYLVRVKLAPGAVIPPHTHPDARNTTVLSGTIYVGFGDRFNESDGVAIPVGAVYVAPAGVAHFIWVGDGEVLYQESGQGPTAIDFIEQPLGQGDK